MASVKIGQEDFTLLLISTIRFTLRGSASTHPRVICGSNDENLVITRNAMLLCFPPFFVSDSGASIDTISVHITYARPT